MFPLAIVPPSGRSRRVTAPGLILRSSSTGLGALATGSPGSPLTVNWNQKVTSIHRPFLPFLPILPSKNYFLYLGHYSDECCTVSAESDPPDSLHHRGPGLDCHRVSAWSLFLHHSSGNTETRISSLTTNQELDLWILICQVNWNYFLNPLFFLSPPFPLSPFGQNWGLLVFIGQIRLTVFGVRDIVFPESYWEPSPRETVTWQLK